MIDVSRSTADCLSAKLETNELTARHILTVAGKEKWVANNIKGILINKKYMDCARVQKPFTPGFLTKKCGQVSRCFEAKVWYFTDKYRRVIYCCNNMYGGVRVCGRR